MKIKKVPIVLSFAFATLLVVGTTTFAQESDNGINGNRMNDNGISNMINACGDFMDSYESEKDNK